MDAAAHSSRRRRPTRQAGASCLFPSTLFMSKYWILGNDSQRKAKLFRDNHWKRVNKENNILLSVDNVSCPLSHTTLLLNILDSGEW